MGFSSDVVFLATELVQMFFVHNSFARVDFWIAITAAMSIACEMCDWKPEGDEKLLDSLVSLLLMQNIDLEIDYEDAFEQVFNARLSLVGHLGFKDWIAMRDFKMPRLLVRQIANDYNIINEGIVNLAQKIAEDVFTRTLLFLRYDRRALCMACLYISTSLHDRLSPSPLWPGEAVDLSRKIYSVYRSAPLFGVV